MTNKERAEEIVGFEGEWDCGETPTAAYMKQIIVEALEAAEERGCFWGLRAAASSAGASFPSIFVAGDSGPTVGKVISGSFDFLKPADICGKSRDK